MWGKTEYHLNYRNFSCNSHFCTISNPSVKDSEGLSKLELLKKAQVMILQEKTGRLLNECSVAF